MKRKTLAVLVLSATLTTLVGCKFGKDAPNTEATANVVQTTPQIEEEQSFATTEETETNSTAINTSAE